MSLQLCDKQITAYKAVIKGKLLNRQKKPQKNGGFGAQAKFHLSIYFLIHCIRSVLVRAVPKTTKRLAARQFEWESFTALSITDIFGLFSMEGFFPSGDLELFAGYVPIGDVTISPAGVVESGGDLGNIVEDPIPTFTPTCAMPTQTYVPEGTVLARVPLSDGVFEGEVGAGGISAQVSKSPRIINDWVVTGEYYQLGSYMALDPHGSVISVKMTPPAGQKVVVTGFGIKSAAFSNFKEGLRYIVRSSPTAAYVDASDYFAWDQKCPDDGQPHQVYLSTAASETPWDAPLVSLSLMNNKSSGRWHLSNLEVYGYLLDAPVWTTATTNAAAATTEAPGAATTEAPAAVTTTEAVLPVTTTAAAGVTTTAPATTTTEPCSTHSPLPDNYSVDLSQIIGWTFDRRVAVGIPDASKVTRHNFTTGSGLRLNGSWFVNDAGWLSCRFIRSESYVIYFLQPWMRRPA